MKKTLSGWFPLQALLGLWVAVLASSCGNQRSSSTAAQTRQVINLNQSDWKFVREDFPAQEPSRVEFDDSSWLDVTIPHDWNGGSDGVHDDVFDGPEMYLGPAWYRARLRFDAEREGQRLSVRFEAVSSKAEVWLNGTFLGEHRGGYTAFELDATEAARLNEENVLAIRASNENDPEIAPWMAIPFGNFPSSSDYAVYGGIYRDVWLVATHPVAIESHRHETPFVSPESAELTFQTRVSNMTSEAVEATLVTDVIDEAGALVESVSESERVEAGGSFDFRGQTTVTSPRLWSPEAPSLYQVHSRVLVNGAEVDAVQHALGFRSYTLQNGTAFVLNGQSSFLSGVNRHQDKLGRGYALSNEDHVADVQTIKSLGFNFIRHAHYPADPAFVQACDELGVLLWQEIPVSTTVSPSPGFLDNAKSQLTEMIEQSYNHPSVIVWGIGNESDRIGDPSLEAPAAYTTTALTELNALAKSLDETRPTTGCNFVYPDNANIVDVYSPQEWSGWYSGTYTQYNPSSLIGEYGASIHLSHHDEDFVSSGSVQPWTQEYGAEYHEYKASLGRSRQSEFPGHLVWVAFDFASPRGDRATNPIPYMNQKGLFLHDHETRKDLAYFYESFNTDGRDNPMVYVVSETWLDRIAAPGPLTVWAYSNAETVELFTGTPSEPKATSLGVASRNAGPRGDTRFEWPDAMITGPVLTAEATIDGEVVATHSLTFEGDW